MSLQQILTVFKKECTDSLRDRRSLGSALLFSLFGPLVVAGMIGTLAEERAMDGPLEVAFVGAERAPNLVDFLAAQGIVALEAPADVEEAVRRGEVDFAVRLAEDYGESFRTFEPAVVELVFDGSRERGFRDMRRVRDLVEAWSGQVAQQRLVLRGVDPRITRPVRVELRDFATPRARGVRVLGSLPMFFLLAAFFGAMNVAIDVTAGERERGSLESLLVHAISTRTLATGKWLATTVFGLLAVALTLAVSVVVFRPERFEGLGVRVDLGVADALAILCVLLPLVLLAPALQMLIAMFSKNFKEAQTYISLLLFVPMVPGFLLLLEVLDIVPWMHAVPVLA
jgi:sodium transport system permease protein